MNAAENKLVQLLTGKPSLQEVTVNELEQIVNQYPYFSLGQLLFTKKIRESKQEHFADQLQHCAVYFQDVTWLQGKLYSKEIPAGTKNEDAGKKEIPGTYILKKEESVSDIPVAEKDIQEEKIENANLITLPAKDVLEGFTLQISDVHDEPELPPLDEEELAANDEAATEASIKIADVLQQQAEEFKAPVEEADLPISTESYHTIDYFASQGIKIDTQVPDDVLTKKVHTFTDWLRRMKRINSYPTDLGSDVDMETFVQSIADTSNQSKAIYTEAMAEVLVKQGKIDKAIEVYEKLSLLNPGKTAYFAAKINRLKA